jgi:hypothetical protein
VRRDRSPVVKITCPNRALCCKEVSLLQVRPAPESKLDAPPSCTSMESHRDHLPPLPSCHFRPGTSDGRAGRFRCLGDHHRRRRAAQVERAPQSGVASLGRAPCVGVAQGAHHAWFDDASRDIERDIEEDQAQLGAGWGGSPGRADLRDAGWLRPAAWVIVRGLATYWRWAKSGARMTDASVQPPPVMPAPGSSARGQAPAGIHDLPSLHQRKSWIPAFAGMTGGWSGAWLFRSTRAARLEPLPARHRRGRRPGRRPGPCLAGHRRPCRRSRSRRLAPVPPR